jgi:hypothetical protein
MLNFPHIDGAAPFTRGQHKDVVVRDGVISFVPLKHNSVVAPLARLGLRLMTHRLEKVVFTATTGRSGTKTLAKFLSTVRDCTALHEPYPIMCGPVLRAATYGNTALADKVYWRIKSINILRAAVASRYYIEANHCFIKTFVQQAIEDFSERLAVIHLVRPPIEVAMSIYRLQDYPGTDAGNTWWLDYRAPTNLIQIADLLELDAEFSHPFYKALWYWYEVEMRIAAWCTKVPTLKVVRFETDWLNHKQKLMELLDNLGIDYEESQIEPMVGQLENMREGQKRIAALPNEQAQHMLCRFHELLSHRGIDISIISPVSNA